MLGILKAMRTTLGHLPQRKITVQYPEQREQLPERSRGLFRVVIDPATDDPRCRCCTLCETNCPVQVIRVNYESKYALPAVNEARIGRARSESQPTHDLALLAPVIDHYRETGTGMMAVLQHTQEIYGYLPRRGPAGDLARDRRVAVAALRRGELLRPVPALAGRPLRRSPSATAPPAMSPARRSSPKPSPTSSASRSARPRSDRLFTLQTVSCVGACALAPVVQVGDDETHGRMTPDKARALVTELKHRAEVDR